MAERLTEIELDGVQLHVASTKSLVKNQNLLSREDDIETGLGMVHVEVQGDTKRPAIITYHDIGLNSTTCFQGFFSYDDMQPILKHFCVYHVNAPGQQHGSLPLSQGPLFRGRSANEKLESISTIRSSESEKLLSNVCQETGTVTTTTASKSQKRPSFAYPSMDQLATMIDPILQFYGIKTFIGFGVGAGANILCRYALVQPDRVDALVLINCSASKPGWTEWGYQKLNAWHLKGGSISASVEEYLLWHWFGKKTMERNYDLVKTYKDYIKHINPTNLALFIESYIKRTDLGITRDITKVSNKECKNFKCPVMLVAGEYSPHLDDTVNMNGRVDPTVSNWMKFECGGMVLEEQPGKLSEAFRLFLQSMGHVPSLSQTKIVASKTALSKSSIAPAVSAVSAIGEGGDNNIPRQTVC